MLINVCSRSYSGLFVNGDGEVIFLKMTKNQDQLFTL